MNGRRSCTLGCTRHQRSPSKREHFCFKVTLHFSASVSSIDCLLISLLHFVITRQVLVSSLWGRFVKGQGRKAAVGQFRFLVLVSVRDTWPLCCPGQDVSNDVWDLAANCIAVFWWESLLPRQRKLPLICTHGTSGPGTQNFSKFVVTRLWPVLRMYNKLWLRVV